MLTPRAHSAGPAAVVLVFGLLWPGLLMPQQGPAPAPPIAEAVPHLDTSAGVPWHDPYAWLRDDKRQRPEVLAHLRAENAYTEAMMSHTKGLQDRLYKEMVGHTKENDLTVPELDHGYYYYTRTLRGQED